jgi:hypothetical protein
MYKSVPICKNIIGKKNICVSVYCVCHLFLPITYLKGSIPLFGGPRTCLDVTADPELDFATSLEDRRNICLSFQKFQR